MNGFHNKKTIHLSCKNRLNYNLKRFCKLFKKYFLDKAFNFRNLKF